MKNNLFTSISIALLSLTNITSASAAIKADSSKFTIPANAVNAVSMTDYRSFKQSVAPLIKKMGTKEIVGLGEGTHGTADFYKLRFWISRILIEEKGFNNIAFENDLSDGWLMNRQLNTNADLDSLMKKHMLSIWQNKETKELLAWVRQYNRSHTRKVKIDGLDYVYLNPDVEILQKLLLNTKIAGLTDSLASLARYAAYQDASWEGENIAGFKFDDKKFIRNAYSGYLTADKLDKDIMASKIPGWVKTDCHLAAVNIMQAFGPFYNAMNKMPEASRDSSMAYNAGLIMKERGTKMIIWAHNVHLAKAGIYNDEVGGTGGKILKMFPNKYFVLGTGTATGTFAATTQSRDTYTNPMKAYPLQQPIANSWEEILNKQITGAGYFYPQILNPNKESRPMRFIGYGPNSGPTAYDKTNISDLFDAFIFIKDTHAATPLK